MTCRGAQDWILAYATGGTVPPQAATHISECESCRGLADAFGRNQPLASPSPSQLLQIKAKLRENLKPVRPLPAAGIFVAAFLVVATIAVSIGAVDLGTAGWHALTAVRKIAVFAALAAGFGTLAFSLARQLTPGSVTRSPLGISLVSLLAIMAAIFMNLFDYHEEKSFVATGLVCLSIGIECAIPVAALCWLILRRGMIVNPIAAGALTGAIAGLSGLTLLEIFCPNPDKYHILVWHLGAAIASTLGGATIGALIEHLGWRANRK